MHSSCTRVLDNSQDYHTFTYSYWCNLAVKLKVKLKRIISWTNWQNNKYGSLHAESSDFFSFPSYSLQCLLKWYVFSRWTRSLALNIFAIYRTRFWSACWSIHPTVMLKVTTAQVNFVNFTTGYNGTQTTVWCFFYSYLCNETPLWYLCFTHRTVGSFSSKLLLFYHSKCPSWLDILNSFVPPCIILSELNKWANFTMQNKMKVKQHVYK